MFYTDEYRESGSKVDEQISKLQQCKNDMISIFKDLDNLENDISIYKYGNHNTSHHTSYLSRDYSSSSDNNSLSNESTCSCKNKRFDNVYSSEEDIKYIRHRHYDDDDDEIDYKPPPPKPDKYRPNSKLTFSYKIPKSSYEPIQSNTKLDLDKFYQRVAVSDIKRSNSVSFDPKNNRNSRTVNNYSSLSMSRPKPKKKVEKFVVKPKWVPNGKFDNSVNSRNFLSSSTTSLNRPISRSSSTSSKVTAASVTTPWKHTLKAKPDNPMFLSSTDLTKSLDNIRNSRPSKKKPPVDPKDIGGGWKPIYKSKESLDIYSEMRVEQENTEKDKPVKKKVLIDEKDVGKGWKSVGKIKEEGLKIYSTPPNLIDDAEKSKEVKKKKLIIDEKDVGKGWKSTGKIKESDLKIYSTPPNLIEEPDKSNKEAKKKKLVDEKDVGKGWKPAGKIKEDIFPKSDKAISNKPALSTDNLKIEKKSIETKDVGKGWKPAGNSQTTGKPPPPPPTNKPPVPTMTKRSKLVKSATVTKNNEETNKSTAAERFATSTPNRSFDLKVENQELMDESIIQQAPDEPISNNNSKNKSNSSNNDQNNNSRNKSKKDEALDEKIIPEDENNQESKTPIPQDEKPKDKTSNVEDEDDEEEVFDDEVPVTKQDNKKDENKKENLDESIKIDKESEITDPKSKITDENSEKTINQETVNEKNDEEEDDEEDEKQLWNLKDDDDDEE